MPHLLPLRRTGDRDYGQAASRELGMRLILVLLIRHKGARVRRPFHPSDMLRVLAAFHGRECWFALHPLPLVFTNRGLRTALDDVVIVTLHEPVGHLTLRKLNRLVHLNGSGLALLNRHKRLDHRTVVLHTGFLA